MTQTYVRVLGPMQAERDGVPVVLRGPQTRAVLAVLLLANGEPVSTDRLIDAVWPDTPPPSARAQVQAHVCALRRALRCPARDPHATLVSHCRGYRIDTTGLDTDAGRFAKLLQEGRDLLGHHEPGPAAWRLRSALGLWRGPAYADVTVPAVRYVAEALDARRLDCAEMVAEAALALDQHEAVIVELSELVARNPLRERLRGLLMTALARDGRVNAAVAVYRDGCRLIEQELGVAPTRALRDTFDAIVRGAPGFRPGRQTATVTAARRTPHTLPPPLPDPVGREELTAALRGRLAGPGAGAPTCVAITGLPGVGKTVTAMSVAHAVRSGFPDGHIFVDLSSGRDRAHPAPDALAQVLTAMGVPAHDLPADIASRSAAVREALCGRRMLLVVDGAASESQLRPLLPAEPGCPVLVTSRRRLTGLDQVDRVPLGPLTPAAGLALLHRLSGGVAVDADAAAAAGVVRLCGGLPLALRVAGARLANRNLSCRQLLARLAPRRHRLDWLSVGELSVGDALRDAIRGVPPAHRRLLGRIGAMDLPVFAGRTAAALLGVPPERAALIVDDLVEAHLVEPDGGGVNGPHYTVHPLLRLAVAVWDDSGAPARSAR
jgi:DNA-binding SARP family transcriptional activator